VLCVNMLLHVPVWVGVPEIGSKKKRHAEKKMVVVVVV